MLKNSKGPASVSPRCNASFDKHKGRIWAHSVPQQGSAFYFTVGTQEKKAVGQIAKEVLPAVAGEARHAPMVRRSLRLQLMLAELELAVTFCRIVRSNRSENTNRLLRKCAYRVV